ncbi:hypothetical protein DFH06DRAFT_1343638 [Mycena polygramma]|nr:hypothetical protein DFH06DRAFT_1343638 [Mycena polygramma]
MSSCLPQELVDAIVDKIYEDKDIPSLKSCSLAARTFVSPARRYLFRRIEILPPRPACNPCQRFHQLLISSPHIASFVEELCIVLVSPKSYYDYPQRRPATWVMDSPTLALILPLLDLKRISITENARMSYIRLGDSSLNWLRLQPKLKSTLMDIFSSLKLEAVHLRGLVIESPCDLLSLFSETTSLKEMSLSRIYFTNGYDMRGPWPESRQWRPQLRSLLISEMRTNRFWHYMTNPQIDLTRLSSLTVRTDSMSGARLLQATRVASGSLEHLRLWETHNDTGSSNFEEILDLNLRTVHKFSSSVLGVLGPFFQACPHDSRLERIVFEGHGAELPVSLDTDLNTTIESIVAHVAQLRSLTMVEFRVRGVDWVDADLLREWTTELRDALPSLEQRGLLRVTEVPGQEDEADHGWE